MDARALVRRAALFAAIGATGLSALGRFASALALTLGASVAIVSALWLSGFVSRLQPSSRDDRGDGRPAARIDRKYGSKAALRYAFAGILLFVAVRWLPREIPWLLTGLSVVVAALAVEMVKEVRREAARGKLTAKSPRTE
jgi:hypothetical protein